MNWRYIFGVRWFGHKTIVCLLHGDVGSFAQVQRVCCESLITSVNLQLQGLWYWLWHPCHTYSISLDMLPAHPLLHLVSVFRFALPFLHSFSFFDIVRIHEVALQHWVYSSTLIKCLRKASSHWCLAVHHFRTQHPTLSDQINHGMGLFSSVLSFVDGKIRLCVMQ